MNTADISTPAPRLHLAYLDGVRGLAALYVVLYHVRMHFGGAIHGVWGLLLNPFRGGHFAVAVFIVLSGFCLTLPAVRTGTLRAGAADFYKRRARRILPPMLASVVLGAVCALVLRAVGRPDIPPVTGRVLLVNALLLQDVLAPYNSVNSVLWSVAVEWKIYFLFPLLLSVWRRGGLGLTLLAGIVLSVAAFALLNTFFPGLNLKYVCPWYVGLFTAGMGAAFLSHTNNFGRWRMAAFVLAALLAVQSLFLPLPEDTGSTYSSFLWMQDTLAGLTAAAFLLFLSTARTKAARAWARALSARPLVGLGTFAYSLYLVHSPLLAVMTGALGRVPILRASPAATGAVLVCAGVPLIIAFAYGFFWVCERPFLNTRRGETPAEAARDAALSPAP